MSKYKITREIKKYTKLIRDYKTLRKEEVNPDPSYPGIIASLKYEVRHRHIAWGLLKGKQYKEIERSVKSNNEPCIEYINLLKSRHYRDLLKLRKAQNAYKNNKTITNTSPDIAVAT